MLDAWRLWELWDVPYNITIYLCAVRRRADGTEYTYSVFTCTIIIIYPCHSVPFHSIPISELIFCNAIYSHRIHIQQASKCHLYGLSFDCDLIRLPTDWRVISELKERNPFFWLGHIRFRRRQRSLYIVKSQTEKFAIFPIRSHDLCSVHVTDKIYRVPIPAYLSVYISQNFWFCKIIFNYDFLRIGRD